MIRTTPHFRLVLALFFAAADVSFPLSAFAAPTEASAPQTEYRAALKAMKQQDYATARKILLDLWSRTHTYDVATALGQLEFRQKNYAASARYLAYALANVPPREDLALLQRLRTALEEVKPHVGAVRISVSESAADVRVNGESVGVSPLGSDVFLDPGTYEVEARLGADRVAKQELVVSAGATYNLALDIPAATEPPAASPPSTVVQSSAPPPRRLPPEPPADVSSRSMIPAFVGVGIATVGLGMAIGFGIGAENAKNQSQDIRRRFGTDGCTWNGAVPSECAAARDTYDRQRTDATLTKVGIGTFAVGTVATLAYVLFWPSDTSRSTARSAAPRPVVAMDRNGGSFLLSGQF